MPRISSFYGIVIYVYRPDHPSPHFHAQYGEHIAQITLDTLDVLNGTLPVKRFGWCANGRRYTRPNRPKTGSSLRRSSPWSRSTRSLSISTMLRVTHVEPLNDFRLRLEFSDGVIREIDCRFLTHGTLGEPLRDPDYFRQVRVDKESRTIIWPNGLDPSPELLHEYQPADAAEGTSERAVA